MKKLLFGSCIVVISCTSCATILGGKISKSQRTIPKPGQEERKVRLGYLIADLVIFPPLVIVDFATCAIYQRREDNGEISE